MPLTLCVGKITFNGTVVQRFLEKVCLSNGNHHLAEFARGQSEFNQRATSICNSAHATGPRPFS